jgi:hypothetical protein
VGLQYLLNTISKIDSSKCHYYYIYTEAFQIYMQHKYPKGVRSIIQPSFSTLAFHSSPFYLAPHSPTQKTTRLIMMKTVVERRCETISIHNKQSIVTSVGPAVESKSVDHLWSQTATVTLENSRFWVEFDSILILRWTHRSVAGIPSFLFLQ